MSGAQLKDVLAQFPPPDGALSFPKPIGLADLLAMEIPRRELLLSPWLPEKGLTMIAAPRGIGKTHLALNIAYAVASGGSFLRWRAVRPRPVLYIDGEMPAVVLQERLACVAKQADATSAPDALALMAADLGEFGIPDLSSTAAQAALMPQLDAFDLIVMDNLSTLCRSGQENEAESWGAMQGFLLALRRVGKSALFIHHTGKNGAQRGTSKREDVLDTVLLLKRPDDYETSQGARFIVQFSKARGFTGAEAEPFEAALDPLSGLWTTKIVSESREAQIIERKELGLSIREIASELGLSKSAVGRHFKRLNGGADRHLG